MVKDASSGLIGGMSAVQTVVVCDCIWREVVFVKTSQSRTVHRTILPHAGAARVSPFESNS